MDGVKQRIVTNAMNRRIKSKYLKNGIVKSYYDNGRICEEGIYKDGKRHGQCITWYPNGEKELHAYFKEGKPCNIWIHWDKYGNYDWINMDLRY